MGSEIFVKLDKAISLGGIGPLLLANLFVNYSVTIEKHYYVSQNNKKVKTIFGVCYVRCLLCPVQGLMCLAFVCIGFNVIPL